MDDEAKPEEWDDETIALLKYDRARNAGEHIFVSEYEIRKRAKEKGISLVSARRELRRERQHELKHLSDKAKKFVLSTLPKPLKKKFGVKGAGRPKGRKNIKVVMSKDVFIKKLRQLARSKDQIGEVLTQKEAAEVLGLGGTRQLRHKLKDHDGGRSWREFLNSLLA